MNVKQWQSATYKSYVVIGLGRFGSSLAVTLHEFGHSVLALDCDPEPIQRLSKLLPDVRQIDVTRFEVMQGLDAGPFDTGIACIGNNFESNLLATVILKRLGVEQVIAKALTVIQREILLRIGADEVILPEQEAGMYLGRKLIMGVLLDFLEIASGVGFMKMEAPPAMWNRTLAEYQLRRLYRLTAVAVYRDDKVIVDPSASFQIAKDDILMLLGKFADAHRLWVDREDSSWLPWK